jgi:hypothetical protein
MEFAPREQIAPAPLLRQTIDEDLPPMYDLQEEQLVNISLRLIELLSTTLELLSVPGMNDLEGEIQGVIRRLTTADNLVVAINQAANMIIVVERQMVDLGMYQDAVGLAVNATSVFVDYDPDVAEIVRWESFSDPTVDVYVEEPDDFD